VANLQPYSSFESGATIPNGNACTLSFDTAHFQANTRALKVVTTAAGTGWIETFGLGGYAYEAAVTPGGTYTISAYIYASSASSSVRIDADHMDSSHTHVSFGAGSWITPTQNAWTRLSFTEVVPGDTSYVATTFEWQSPTPSGAVFWFDAMQVEAGSSATAWSPGPNDPATVLSAPTNLHTTAVAATTISLAWNAVTGASGYELVVTPVVGPSYNSDGVAVTALSVTPSTAAVGATMTATYTIQTNQSVTFAHLCAAVRDSANIDGPTLDFANEDSLTINTTTHAHTITRSWDHADTFHTHIAYQIGTSAWVHITTPTIDTVITGSGALAKQGFSPGGPFMSLSSSDRTSDITAMAAMNGKWARIDYGGGDPSFFTSVADELASHSIQTLAVINGADTSAFQSLCNTFALAAIDHGVRVFELWNEANIGTGGVTDATDYTNRILKPGYTGIKAAATTRGVTVTVLMTGMSPGGGSQDPATFLTAIYNAGGGGYFDAGNIHPYTWPDLPTAGDASWNTFLKTQGFHDVLNSHGDGAMKVWATEVGWPTGGGTGSVSEATQASMATTFCSNWYSYYPSFAGPMMWYSVRDYGQPGTEGYFGLTRQDFSHKPAFATLASAYAGM
jgi:hypothetical protein